MQYSSYKRFSSIRVKISGNVVAKTRVNAMDSGENNLYYIGKNRENNIPPTQVNTEVSQSAVSEIVLSNFIIPNSAKNDNDGAVFTAGFAKGTGAEGLVRNASKAFGNDALKQTVGESKTLLDETQAAHPIAGDAGYMSGKMAEYIVDKNVMSNIPGVGTALDKAGNSASMALGGAGAAGAKAATFFTGEKVIGRNG